MPYTTNNEPAGVQLVFGLLSNTDVSNTLSETNVVRLDQINMDYNLFKYLFYYTASESFSIAKANDAYSLLKFINLSLNGNPLSLVDIFLTTFENNNNTNRISLNPLSTITLVKYLSQYSSVVDVLPYSISLSYPDLISALTESLVIKASSSPNDTAEIIVLLAAKIFSPVISTSITFNIPVRVIIPGYINPTPASFNAFIPEKPLQFNTVLSNKQAVVSTKYSYEEIDAPAGEVLNNVNLGDIKLTSVERVENPSTDNSILDQNDTSSDDAEVW